MHTFINVCKNDLPNAANKCMCFCPLWIMVLTFGRKQSHVLIIMEEDLYGSNPKQLKIHSYAHYNDMGGTNTSFSLSTRSLVLKVGGIIRKPRYHKTQNKGEF